MRRTVLPFSLFGLLTVALAAIGPGAGCSNSLSGQGDGDRANKQEAPGIPEQTAPSLGGTDASAWPPQYVRGSPLCGVSADQHCMPDDDGTNPSDAGATCATPPNASEADTSVASACRIRSDGTRAPQCFADQADRRGVDGVACESGADCAPGFECIDSDRGGVCRRYCCNPDSCSSHVSMNGGPTFCDIQKVVAADSHKAPVCMPLKKCKLLHEGECSELETCAIVTDKGESGCVPTGSAEVGDSCDEEHCQHGLTCLGSPGGRRCFQLCRTDGNDCGATQTCTTGAVFQNTAFGVCRDAR